VGIVEGATKPKAPLVWTIGRAIQLVLSLVRVIESVSKLGSPWWGSSKVQDYGRTMKQSKLGPPPILVCLSMFGDGAKYARLCSLMFRYVRVCSGMFGDVRVCSGMFGYVRICSAMLGHVRLSSDAAGCCWALDISQSSFAWHI